LLIPKPLSQYAVLDKELLIVGMTSFIEIWDPKQYEDELNKFSQENPEIITLKDIVTSTEYKAKQIQMLMDEEKVLIQQYLVDNKINVLPSASGLYYMESKKGKGKSPVKGQLCKVNYKGMLLDGTVFDSSQGREPFAFQLGEGQVIKGWDEGIALMQKGGKALLLIPSHLAYGERGAGDMIPPYSPLLFEVELIDFK
jgi:FKBP-type peptidyl-prolyl cis-trans isomerase